MNKTLAIAIIAIVALFIGLGIAPYVEQWIYPSTGQIEIEVYLTNIIDTIVHANGTEIRWGNVTPGSAYAVTLNVTNLSPINVTVLVLAPTIPSYLTLTWSPYNNTQLDAGQTFSADLILDVDLSATPGDTFNYDMIVAAEEIP